MIGQQLEHIMLNEQATIAFGRCISNAIAEDAATLYLCGDLGAGKTTLCRGIVQGFGHIGAVKSPTYTLVEPYTIAGRSIYHFDLYRLTDAQELEFLGVDDYFSQPAAVCFFEWPERGEGVAPEPDLTLSLSDYFSENQNDNAGDDVSYAFPDGRKIVCQADSPRGTTILKKLKVQMCQ